MLEYQLWVLLAAIGAGSFLQGFAGFGFSMLALPFMAMVMDIQQAVVIAALANTLICALHLMHLRKDIKLQDTRDLLMGGAVGLPIGIMILKVASTGLTEILLALAILAFVGLSSLNLISLCRLGTMWGYLFGFLAGVLGAAVAIPAPPVLIYSYLKRWDKNLLKATISAVMFSVAAVSSVLYFFSGITQPGTYDTFAKSLPVLLLCYCAGNFLFTRIKSEHFRKFILAALAALALIMLHRNLF